MIKLETVAHICKYRKNRDFWQVILSHDTVGQQVARVRNPGRLRRRRVVEEEKEEAGEAAAMVHLRGVGGVCAPGPPRPSPSSSRLPGSRPWGPWPDQQGEPATRPRTVSATSACPPLGPLLGTGVKLLAPPDGRASRGSGVHMRPVPARLASREASHPAATRGTPGSPEKGRGHGVCTPPRMGTRARAGQNKDIKSMGRDQGDGPVARPAGKSRGWDGGRHGSARGQADGDPLPLPSPSQ